MPLILFLLLLPLQYNLKRDWIRSFSYSSYSTFSKVKESCRKLSELRKIYKWKYHNWISHFTSEVNTWMEAPWVSITVVNHFIWDSSNFGRFIGRAWGVCQAQTKYERSKAQVKSFRNPHLSPLKTQQYKISVFFSETGTQC